MRAVDVAPADGGVRSSRSTAASSARACRRRRHGGRRAARHRTHGGRRARAVASAAGDRSRHPARPALDGGTPWSTHVRRARAARHCRSRAVGSMSARPRASRGSHVGARGHEQPDHLPDLREVTGPVGGDTEAQDREQPSEPSRAAATPDAGRAGGQRLGSPRWMAPTASMASGSSVEISTARPHRWPTLDRGISHAGTVVPEAWYRVKPGLTRPRPQSSERTARTVRLSAALHCGVRLILA